MDKQKFIEKIQIQFPKSRIDTGINLILENFKSNKFVKLFNIFNFSNIQDKIYKIEDIKSIYYLSELQVYLVEIILNNPHLLDNYFNSEFDLYNLFNESTCYFILIKLKLKLFTNYKPNKEIINKFIKYLGHINKLFDLDFREYQDFFQKNIDLDKKRNILLSIYRKSLNKTKRNIFLLFWIIQEDINHSILDKYEDINEYEKFNQAEKIADIFLEKEIKKEKIFEIEEIQKKYKVIDNYKLFKENILSL